MWKLQTKKNNIEMYFLVLTINNCFCDNAFHGLGAKMNTATFTDQRPNVRNEEFLWLIFFHILELQVREFLYWQRDFQWNIWFLLSRNSYAQNRRKTISTELKTVSWNSRVFFAYHFQCNIVQGYLFNYFFKQNKGN